MLLEVCGRTDVCPCLPKALGRVTPNLPPDHQTLISPYQAALHKVLQEAEHHWVRHMHLGCGCSILIPQPERTVLFYSISEQ